MNLEDREVAWATETADESAKTGTIQDGAEVAEAEVRKHGMARAVEGRKKFQCIRC